MTMEVNSPFHTTTVKKSKGLFGKETETTTYFDDASTAPARLQLKKKAATKEKQPKTNKSKEFKMRVGQVIFGTMLLTEIWSQTGQVQADEDHCTDAGHQQIVTESGKRASARDLQSTILSAVGIGHGPKDQTTSAVSNQLTASHGYSISEAQLINKNKNSGVLQHNDRGQLQNQFAAGIHCLDVPGPVYGGFERIDDSESLHQVAVANLLSVTALKKLNPTFKEYGADKELKDGTVLKVDKKSNKDFVYREISSKEKDINTMSEGKEKKRTELLKINAATIGSGGSVSKGEEAFVRAEETGWMKKYKIGLDDIKKEFPTTEITAMKQTGVIGNKVDNASIKRELPEKAKKTEVSKVSDKVSLKATKELESRGKSWEHRAQAIRYFIDNGLADYQATAIVGNLVIECGNDVALPSHIRQFGGGPGMGCVQWEGARSQRLVKFADKHGKSWTDFQLQLDFIMEEFETTEAKAYQWLKSTKNVTDATYAVLNGYERPRDRILGKRLTEAKKALAGYHGAVKIVRKANKS